MSSFNLNIKHINKWLIAPYFLCFATIIYVQISITNMHTLYDTTTQDTITEQTAQNRLISYENSQKIDELHAEVVKETINRFRAEDMQAWITTFKRDNPELHIPELKLDRQ